MPDTATITCFSTRLEAKVAAANDVNRAASAAWPRIAEALRPFIGQKVKTADGALTKKVQAALPTFPTEWPPSYYRAEGYSIWAHFRASRNSRDGDRELASYAERSLYLGEVQNGILIRVEEPQALRTDFSADAIRDVRAQLKAAQADVNRLRGQLFDFGEYDQ